MLIYVVQEGDTVDSIAENTGVPVSTIIFNNQLVYPYRLAVGQALLVTYQNGEERRLVRTSGYAYPFINQNVLRQALPYLTAMNIFSYGFTENGDLIRPMIDDSFLIQLAIDYGVRPVLTLTPIDASGTFNNNLISAMIHNPEAEANLISQLVQELETRGLQGVDIDFEYIKAEDRERFAGFVANVRAAVNAIGYQVSVALAPKTSDDQPGLLYEGKDYALLGEAADNVLLMTYEWGYTFSEPMAVAPIDKVRRVVEYALTRIPPEKTNLGIPNYGYDWALPYVKGVTRANSIGNLEAVQIAIDYGAVIQYDPVAQTPWFRYVKDGIEHEVWFEDVRSFQAKFGLIQEYNLMGAGFWQLMRPFLPGWLLMSGTFWIE